MMMRHKLQMLPEEYREKISRVNIIQEYPLYNTLNRRQRNGWTIDIHECHRHALRQLEEPALLQRDDIAPWEHLPYECRIY